MELLMRRRWSIPFLAFLLAGAVLTTLPACFHPAQPACAFSCVAPPHSCPTGYTCGSDDLCHNDKNPGLCDIGSAPDAGSDAR
jgi:hypothetical protein